MTVQDTITEKLTAALAPLHLQVMNESHKHSVPPGSESHFKVVFERRVENLRRVWDGMTGRRVY